MSLIMYLPTRSASSLRLVLTLLCTLKPVCLQLSIFFREAHKLFAKQERENLPVVNHEFKL